jgi:hypothetical protein
MNKAERDFAPEEPIIPTNTMTPFEAALEYIAKWYVFPAEIIEETNIKKSHWSAEFSESGLNWGMTKNAEQIRLAFRRWPNAGIGVPTGIENGFFVVEADTIAGHGVDGITGLRELEARHDQLPPTLMAVSPSGSLHHYFKHPGNGIKIKSSALASCVGIDVKGDGGFVVVPPTKRDDGQYRWLNNHEIADAPEWLLNLVRDRQQGSTGGNSRQPPPKGEEGPWPSTPFTDWKIAEINNAALAYLAAWVPALFPAAKERNGGWRITSADLGRNHLMEDISITTQGIKDFGLHDYGDLRRGRRTPIQLVYIWKQWEPEQAAEWLRLRLNIDAEDAPTNTQVSLIKASCVVVRAKQWIWRGHLLLGALELTTGIKGLGKSQTHCSHVACVTTGKRWPNGDPGIQPGNVIMLTAEDCLDQELVPRLIAAGANLERVSILKYIRTDPKTQRQFLLGEDLDKLEQAISEIRGVLLVTIDPITAYMGKMNSHMATDVRSQLGPLKDLAERTNVATSAITHPAKNAGPVAINHFIGSQAFIAAARIGHVCVPEVDQEGRRMGRVLFTSIEGNSSALMPTLAYRVFIRDIPQLDPTTGQPISEVPYIEWESGEITISANQAVRAAHDAENGVHGGETQQFGKQEEVKAFLREALASHDWEPAKQVIARALERGFTEPQLKRARYKLGVLSDQLPGRKGFWWKWVEVQQDRF